MQSIRWKNKEFDDQLGINQEVCISPMPVQTRCPEQRKMFFFLKVPRSFFKKDTANKTYR